MDYIKINPLDNVAVALRDLPVGATVEGITLPMPVPRGHKVLLQGLKAGENVIKYGFPIGHVTRDAAAGTVVDHTCIKTNLEGLLEYKYEPSFDEPEPPASGLRGLKLFASEKCRKKFCPTPAESKPADAEPVTFKGFRRADGQAGVRNQIWVIPTVGCVNGICQSIVERFRAEISGKEGSVDAIVAFPHNYGCLP